MQLETFPWHTQVDTTDKIALAFDQGCYDHVGLMEVGQSIINITDYRNCTSLCSRNISMFAAVQIGVNTMTCSCHASINPLRRLPENLCSSECSYKDKCGINNTYRVLYSRADFSEDQVTKLPWLPTHDSRSDELCAAVGHQLTNDGTVNSTESWLQREQCYQHYPAVCCLHQDLTATILPASSWFEASYNCSTQGGFIVWPGHRCAMGVVGHEVNRTLFWSGLQAWSLIVRGEMTSDHHYTNWRHDEPHFLLTSCIVISPDALWETVNCSSREYYICESDAASTSEAVSAYLSTDPSVTLSTSLATSPASDTTSDVTHGDVTLGSHATRSRTIGIAVGAILSAVIAAFVVVFLVRRNIHKNADFPRDDSIGNTTNEDGGCEMNQPPIYAVPDRSHKEDIILVDNSLYSSNDVDYSTNLDGEITSTHGVPADCPKRRVNTCSEQGDCIIHANELYGVNDNHTPVYFLEQLDQGSNA